MKIINDTKIKIDEQEIKKICSIFSIEPDTVNFVFADDKDVRGLYYKIGESKIITIYINEFETRNSIRWLFFHELRHLYVNHIKHLTNFFEEKDKEFIKKIKKCKSNKNELLLFFLPSEIDADAFATSVVGRDYGDEWRIKRIKKAIKKEKENESNRR